MDGLAYLVLKVQGVSQAFKFECLCKARSHLTHNPFGLEPRHLQRTDQKRPKGLTLVPWAVGRQLLWNVTEVDPLAPSRIRAGLVCNLRTAAAEEEDQKSDKYRDLINDGYILQPIVCKVQGAAAPITEIFLNKLFKKLCTSTDEPRAGSFLSTESPWQYRLRMPPAYSAK